MYFQNNMEIYSFDLWYQIYDISTAAHVFKFRTEPFRLFRS